MVITSSSVGDRRAFGAPVFAHQDRFSREQALLDATDMAVASRYLAKIELPTLNAEFMPSTMGEVAFLSPGLLAVFCAGENLVGILLMQAILAIVQLPGLTGPLARQKMRDALMARLR